MSGEPKRYTVAVDFDGVLCEWHPWEGHDRIHGKPIEGSIEWLRATLEKLDVAIVSVRCSRMSGRNAIRRWLMRHAGEDVAVRVQVLETKPPALVYIDDRAWRFEGPGTLPTPRQIHRARPWHMGER